MATYKNYRVSFYIGVSTDEPHPKTWNWEELIGLSCYDGGLRITDVTPKPKTDFEDESH